MNKNPNYGSLEEIKALNYRRNYCPPSIKYRKWMVEKMEEYDPGAKRSHEIASKYRKED